MMYGDWEPCGAKGVACHQYLASHRVDTSDLPDEKEYTLDTRTSCIYILLFSSSSSFRVLPVAARIPGYQMEGCAGRYMSPGVQLLS